MVPEARENDDAEVICLYDSRDSFHSSVQVSGQHNMVKIKLKLIYTYIKLLKFCIFQFRTEKGRNWKKEREEIVWRKRKKQGKRRKK